MGGLGGASGGSVVSGSLSNGFAIIFTTNLKSPPGPPEAPPRPPKPLPEPLGV